jgi:NAD(P)-dependent dehydrogenase (short-subunit alcohol dehydrogenase family)
VRKVLITGVGTGFGNGVAKRLAAKGFEVITSRETDWNIELLRSLGRPQLMAYTVR